MTASQTYATWVEIDLDAIRGNVALARQAAGAAVLAVVKANGYGHGALQTARAALDGGASWLAVARAEEALELRQAGLEVPLLLMGYTPPLRLAELVRSRVSLAVWDASQAALAGQAARQAGMPARLHLKIDSGMSRLGVQAEQAAALARRLAETPGVIVEAAFTHFARADEADPAPTNRQLEVFRRAVDELEQAGLRPPLIHAANSAAGLTRPDAAFNLVRLGIAMYGLHPSAECPCPPGFRPALAWKAVLSQVKTLPPGRGVSYGHTYVTRGRERLGTVPVGYADGLRRTAGNTALVGGRRVPVVGRVCMDQVLVQLDEVPEARPGDEVVLIGRQGQAAITAEDVAARWGTINYEVVCGIGPRVPRLYAYLSA
jgi:alanine racemase